MRYMMRERVLSWGDDFRIKDADGHEAFYVDGKVFSFGDKLSFKDLVANELVRIEQKLLSIGPQYEIIRGGIPVALVKKHLFTAVARRRGESGRARWKYLAGGRQLSIRRTPL